MTDDTNKMGRFVVVKALGLVTLQASASYDRMHEGFPPSGPLVPSLLERANQRLGNQHCAGIEVCGELTLRALCDLLVATDRSARAVAAGDEITIASGAHRATYVALPNGVALRGFRSYASLGEILRAGDRIDQAGGLLREFEIVDIDTGTQDPRVDDSAPIVRVIAGPDLDAFAPDALAQLARTEWRISSTSNRTGTRLEGPALARRAEYVEQSRPMVLGAIEVPRDGVPIVLGPEHPTTGGYPIVGVIASSDLDAFHSIPLGGRVRFRV
jgi:allophanate hydrolase subunit 2